MLYYLDPRLTITIAAIALSAGLGIIALFGGRGRPDYRFFSAGMLLIAIEGAFSVLCMQADFTVELRKWEYLRMASGAMIPGIWLAFSVCYAREDAKASLDRWKWAILFLAVMPISIVVFLRDYLFLKSQLSLGGNWVFIFNWPAYLFHVLFLVGSVLILVNLEKTLRASSGNMRWRIKFMLLGVGSLFATRIYTSSERLLFSGETNLFVTIESSTLFFSNILIIVSILRTRLKNVSVYVSQDILYNSITILMVGIYLLALGFVAKVAQYFDAGQILFGNAFLIFIALVGMLILLLSSNIQHGIKKFISRHFERPVHNYRKVWSSLTDRMASLVNLQDLCTTVAKVISETFGVAAVSVWLSDEIKNRAVLFGSTHLSFDELEPELKDEIKFLMMSLRDKRSPVMLTSKAGGLQESSEAEITQQGSHGLFRCCVPMVAGGEFLGIVTIGGKFTNEDFTIEDLDLLETMANQTAVFILNHKLFESLGQAREMEAFQTLSAFFIHDLKNLASTLSITLENLPVHYDNPDFRRDALSVMAGSVQKIQGMCSRLSSFNQKPDLNYLETDLNDLVVSTLSDFENLDMVIERELKEKVPAVCIDRDKVRSVLTNLILNAREACGEDCLIRVSTTVEEEYAVIAVKDNGCGIPRDFIDKKLFKPFKSTKTKGLGIGLYQSRIIVQAHGGKIEVESEVGKGSIFRIFLPVSGTNWRK